MAIRYTDKILLTVLPHDTFAAQNLLQELLGLVNEFFKQKTPLFVSINQISHYLITIVIFGKEMLRLIVVHNKRAVSWEAVQGCFMRMHLNPNIHHLIPVAGSCSIKAANVACREIVASLGKICVVIHVLENILFNIFIR